MAGSLKNCVQFVVLVTVASGNVRAQDLTKTSASTQRRIALDSCELSVLRDLLMLARHQELLKLSVQGQGVLKDEQNAVIVVTASGEWLYRHKGSRRDLFLETGSPNDLEQLSQVLESVSLLPHLWSFCNFSTPQVAMALTQPNGPSIVAEAAKLNNSLPKEVIASRIGRALQVVHPSIRQAASDDPAHGGYFADAIKVAQQEDARVLAQIAEGVHAPGVLNDSIRSFAAEVVSGSPDVMLGHSGTVSLKAENEKAAVFTFITAAGDKVYLKVPGMKGITTESAVTDWAQLLTKPGAEFFVPSEANSSLEKFSAPLIANVAIEREGA